MIVLQAIPVHVMIHHSRIAPGQSNLPQVRSGVLLAHAHVVTIVQIAYCWIVHLGEHNDKIDTNEVSHRSTNVGSQKGLNIIIRSNAVFLEIEFRLVKVSKRHCRKSKKLHETMLQMNKHEHAKHAPNHPYSYLCGSS